MGALANYDPTPILEYGYTLREAQFLTLVALHSGHFLRMQFCRFAGVEPGAVLANFVARATGKGHVRDHSFPPGPGKRLHLFYRPIYSRLGLPNSNHRRSDTPSTTIINRIAALDFIIDHPELTFLPTDREKLAYFGSRGIAEDQLPAKTYVSPVGRGESRAYFPDKFPIGLDEKTGELTFLYVDEHQEPTTYFKTHVRNYLPLWRALDQPWRLVFITTSPDKKGSAEPLFRDLLSEGVGESDTRMLDYFRIKRAVERKDWPTLSRADLAARVRLEKLYEAPEHKALYREWCDGKLPQQIPASALKRTPKFELYSPPSFRELTVFPS